MTAPALDASDAEREVPVISPAPLTPAADFGPPDRQRGWTLTAVITALAVITRFLNLGSPTDAGTPIFDEKHYAPQAWQMLHNHGVEDNPGYGLGVHPPVGKWLIALGEAAFGMNPFGWRFAACVFGALLVMATIRLARRLSRSLRCWPRRTTPRPGSSSAWSPTSPEPRRTWLTTHQGHGWILR